MTKRAAAVVLRAERTGLYALAANADRCLRTLAARRCAAEAHALAQQLMARTASGMLQRERVLDVLTKRPAWARLAANQASYSFGTRRMVVNIPRVAPAEALAAMIARTEIRTLLGDADFDLVAHLQTFAACELERLFAQR